MNLISYRPYRELCEEWPQRGQHILATYDENSIIVYQAYRPAIARYAVENQRFGGEFSWSRMSWIKPNYLWMMYRSGWASKEGQEHVLAITIKRSFFDEVLQQAVASTFGSSGFSSHEEWQQALATSDVRLQWDPDHGPKGNSLERRAIQLGLRGEILSRFGRDEISRIEDITPFVKEQAVQPHESLLVPFEQVYRPASVAASQNIGLETRLENNQPAIV